jgi:hypothetical protein
MIKHDWQEDQAQVRSGPENEHRQRYAHGERLLYGTKVSRDEILAIQPQPMTRQLDQTGNGDVSFIRMRSSAC